LVIDTATQILSVALFDGDMLRARHHEVAGRGHAERLLPVIAALPDGGRADRIVVDVGPGSFTGVRIGLAAARALAFAWQAALSGYGTAAIVAAAARERHDTDGPIAVAITGGHGELFWQRFDAQTLAPEAPPVSVPIAELAARVDDPVIYGSGAQALVDARGHGTAVPVDADSASFPALPDDALLAPTPVYGRGADAKPMAVRTGSGT
jgi:tRNA threonylcarbamoyl adenosine modification protein YeaZ